MSDHVNHQQRKKARYTWKLDRNGIHQAQPVQATTLSFHLAPAHQQNVTYGGVLHPPTQPHFTKTATGNLLRVQEAGLIAQVRTL